MEKEKIYFILTLTVLVIISGVCLVMHSENKKREYYFNQDIDQLYNSIVNMTEEVDELIDQRVKINAEIVDLKQQKAELQATLSGQPHYIIVLECKQSHFSLDIDKHMKDVMNKFDFPIEVSEEYYNKYNVGDEISSEFRMGSFIFKGSIGSWKIKVKEKRMEV